MKEDNKNIIKILGKQCIYPLFDNEELSKQYFDVYEKIKNDNPYMDKFNCIYIFMLGIIWGKRIERVRRK